MAFSRFSVCLLLILRSTTSWRTCWPLLCRLLHFLGIQWPFQLSCFGPVDFAFKRDGSRCGPRASSFHPNFRCCVSCREPHCPFSRVALSPFSRVVFQPCLGFHQLAFLRCRYVEIAAFFVSPFTAVSTAPGSCLAPLARSIEASIMASHVFSCVFLHTAKVWTKSCDRRSCFD